MHRIMTSATIPRNGHKAARRSVIYKINGECGYGSQILPSRKYTLSTIHAVKQFCDYKQDVKV